MSSIRRSPAGLHHPTDGAQVASANVGDGSPEPPGGTASPHRGTTTAIYAARALRDFGDGFVAILLPVYLTALGLGPLEVGVVATAALLGSALTTLGIGLLGHRADQRHLLVAAAGLMVLTAAALALSSIYWVVLLVAAIGTMLSQAVTDAERTRMFARYSLIGALAAAIGAFASASPALLADFGIERLAALRSMFLLYAVLGIAGGALYMGLPKGASSPADRSAPPLGPSRGIVYRLAALFSVDAFAGGFAVQSLLALWLFQKFGLSLTAAGLFFFWSGVLAAFSFPVAAWLSRHIGLVNTMVFTHIPSSVCLILAAIAPRLDMALALLLVRAALSQMDVPTRSSYVMAVVTPPERPAAASITGVPRSLAAAVSPALAGALFAAGLQAWPFVICGALKILYDFALLWMFRHIRPPEEQR